MTVEDFEELEDLTVKEGKYGMGKHRIIRGVLGCAGFGMLDPLTRFLLWKRPTRT